LLHLLKAQNAKEAFTCRDVIYGEQNFIICSHEARQKGHSVNVCRALQASQSTVWPHGTHTRVRAASSHMMHSSESSMGVTRALGLLTTIGGRAGDFPRGFLPVTRALRWIGTFGDLAQAGAIHLQNRRTISSRARLHVTTIVSGHAKTHAMIIILAVV
jgi:hypothetical protein